MRRISTPLILCGCLWLVAGGCASSDPGTGSSGEGGTTGVAGSGSGKGGTTGVAGSGSGEGGSTVNQGEGGSTTGVAGSPGKGGTTGAAGSGSGKGGTTGVAGSGSGKGGSTSGSAGTTGAAGSGSGSCTVSVTSGATSTMIKTVGIINWTTTASAITSAKIDFGLTTSYGMTAPVASSDLSSASHKTLLLGMKQSKTYHYKITVSTSGGDCSSDDQSIMTGSLGTGLMKPTLSPTTATGLYGGFLITGQYVQTMGAGATAYILDADGDFVWLYSIGSDVTGARMSYDGNWMWINSANVPNTTAHVHKVSMDGMMDMDLSSKFAGLNHQLTILPDETVAFYAYGSNGCDDIKEYAPSGTVKTIVNAQKARGGTSACHVNNVQYSKDDDSLVFSDLDTTTVTKVKRSDGSTVWSLGGTTQTFTGTAWKGGEHGIHLLGLDKFLTFNNNASMYGGAGNGSILIEVDLNTSAKTYTTKQIYKANPSIQNDVMGDVQLLPNGNYVVAYSTKATLHEIDGSGNKLQTWSWGTQSIGYIEKRLTLYGPPPR